MLTGLPNRQYFGTHLETALRRADPVHGVTLLHVDLDAFGMICNSLGRRVGEQVLVHFAQRLKAVVARERAMIARFHSDEFGILIENTAMTPDINTIVRAINDELAEPFFVEGHGLALSASAGVVHRPVRGIDPAELLRAADQTLRRAKARRRGQWKMFDPVADAADRRAQGLAVGMAGAWENGEIEVRYRPMVRLADGGLAYVEARLQWDRPGRPTLAHERCAALAEATGLVLPLGDWALRTASRRGRVVAPAPGLRPAGGRLPDRAPGDGRGAGHPRHLPVGGLRPAARAADDRRPGGRGGDVRGRREPDRAGRARCPGAARRVRHGAGRPAGGRGPPGRGRAGRPCGSPNGRRGRNRRSSASSCRWSGRSARRWSSTGSTPRARRTGGGTCGAELATGDYFGTASAPGAVVELLV